MWSLWHFLTPEAGRVAEQNCAQLAWGSRPARTRSAQLGIWSIWYGLPGRHSTEEPVDLCITQARYTQLHRYTNYSQG
jgi:hypothetical protein